MDNSKIEWTVSVLLFVAIFAKSNPISNIKTEFRVFCEWFNVMSIKISAAIITAFLAGEDISAKNIKSPTPVFGGKSLASTFSHLALLIGMTLLASQSSHSNYFRYFPPCFSGVFFAQPQFHYCFLCRHCGFSIFCMGATLESRNSSFQSKIWIRHVQAIKAFRCEAITSAFVYAKTVSWRPMLALCTPFFARYPP